MAVSVGFIGLGNMGNPMASNVLKNGFPMTIFDKNSKTSDLYLDRTSGGGHARARRIGRLRR